MQVPFDEKQIHNRDLSWAACFFFQNLQKLKTQLQSFQSPWVHDIVMWMQWFSIHLPGVCWLVKQASSIVCMSAYQEQTCWGKQTCNSLLCFCGTNFYNSLCCGKDSYIKTKTTSNRSRIFKEAFCMGVSKIVIYIHFRVFSSYLLYTGANYSCLWYIYMYSVA